jgi:hypothetical protein
VSDKDNPKFGGPVENEMGTELFSEVQESQGYAFISDDCAHWTDERILARAEQSLRLTVETTKVLRRFIRKHKKRMGKAAP